GHAVHAHLEDRPHRARGDLGNEGERCDELNILVEDEFPDLGRPVRILHRLGANAGALGQVGIGPHLNDFVEGADLRVPERGEGRVLLAVLVRLGIALLDLSQATGLQGVGPELIDHGSLHSGDGGRGAARQAPRMCRKWRRVKVSSRMPRARSAFPSCWSQCEYGPALAVILAAGSNQRGGERMSHAGWRSDGKVEMDTRRLLAAAGRGGGWGGRPRPWAASPGRRRSRRRTSPVSSWPAWRAARGRPRSASTW